MKDLKRMAVYSALALFSIFLLIELAGSHYLSDNLMIVLAVSIVIVLPVVIIVRVAKRERQQAEQQKKP